MEQVKFIILSYALLIQLIPYSVFNGFIVELVIICMYVCLLCQNTQINEFLVCLCVRLMSERVQVLIEKYAPYFSFVSSTLTSQYICCFCYCFYFCCCCCCCCCCCWFYFCNLSGEEVSREAYDKVLIE